jgi:rhodanese-related sulfurtransferase
VGRPDLSPRHTPAELAGLLYDSLHQKLLTLADSVLVYPAHGAGSLCGKNMRAERSSTIGTERLTNYALQIKSREEFIAQLTSNLPARPEYFLKDAEINRTGAAALADLPLLRAIEPAELQTMLHAGEIALDVRPGEEFAAGHVPGSVNIALGGQFASWAGTVLGLAAHPVLIGASTDQLEEARLRLARVGIEVLDGYLAGGVAAWQKAGLPVAKIAQITASELAALLKSQDVMAHDLQMQNLQVLDVRREPEWDALHWFKPWDKVLEWNCPWAKWFVGGQINLSYNCLDRHVATWRKNKAAIIWEGEPGEVHAHLSATADREVSQVRQRAEVARREEGRPRRHLHGHVPELAHRHAGLRPHRRAAHRDLRRLLGQRAGRPHHDSQACRHHAGRLLPPRRRSEAEARRR